MSTQSPKENLPKFDPFQNRLCRDIRNDLSESMMEVIIKTDLAILTPIVKKYTNKDIEPYLHDYIDDRLNRYGKVIAQIKASEIRPDDTFAIAALLWDQELFFEVHEWLEKQWLKATGTGKIILQAVIRAAGTYVHLEHGRREGAKKMADKAVASLVQYQPMVPASFKVEVLIAKLKALDPVPPILGKVSDKE